MTFLESIGQFNQLLIYPLDGMPLTATTEFCWKRICNSLVKKLVTILKTSE